MGSRGTFAILGRGRNAVSACLFYAAAILWPGAGEAAVVIMYHRFGESTHPSTNITIEQFEAHIRELVSGPYTVVSLSRIAQAAREGTPMPDRTIGLSVDDAYLSAYREAWPRLRAAGLPWTLFVATDPVDRNVARYMTWDQIRELAAAGVTIGSQTASHPHMPIGTLEANRAELESANGRFTKELGSAPDLLAYPYGETSRALMALSRDMGFQAAFGQHSGVIGRTAERFYLPRFAMNESYGDMARFRLAANALPLEVSGVTPVDPLLPASKNPPALGFTLEAEVPGLDRLACYTSHEGRVRVERLGGVRMEIRMSSPFPPGRGRINCTVPTADDRWRWYGRQFYALGG